MFTIHNTTDIYEKNVENKKMLNNKKCCQEKLN